MTDKTRGISLTVVQRDFLGEISKLTQALKLWKAETLRLRRIRRQDFVVQEKNEEELGLQLYRLKLRCKRLRILGAIAFIALCCQAFEVYLWIYWVKPLIAAGR